MPNQIEITYETPAQPRQVRLDTTTTCNARCLSCHRHGCERKGEIPAEMIMKILNDVSRWEKPLEEVVPVNYGELFCRKDWLWVLQAISNKLPKTAIVLPTNGALIGEDEAKRLCEIQTLRMINFSINGFYNETYEAFTGLKVENLDKIYHAMQLIRTLRLDIVFRASMVFDPAYMSNREKDYFTDLWRRNNVEPWILPAVSCGREAKTVEIPRVAPCESIFKDIAIGYDGKLSVCCFDPNFSLDLGYYSGDLKKDWISPGLKELRGTHNKHERQNIPLCRSCSHA